MINKTNLSHIFGTAQDMRVIQVSNWSLESQQSENMVKSFKHYDNNNGINKSVDVCVCYKFI